MNKINLIPLLEARGLDNKVLDEMIINDVSTHYNGGVFFIYWDEDDDQFSETKKWLVEFYGEEIKKYYKFAINPT